MFSNTAGQLTGKVSEQYNKVEDYFYLKKANDSLWKANERLYNKLRQNFQMPDTTSITVIDSIKTDSLEPYRKYEYLKATVLENSVTTQSNYIVLGRGKNQGLKEGMGLIDVNNGVVGIITAVTADYAVAMSLLHKDSRIDGQLFRSTETGTVVWDGVTPNILSIKNIPKNAKVVKGDTIISSGNSTSTLPKGMLMGFVTDVIPEKSSNNFIIKFKSAANFYSLQYIYAIDDAKRQLINEVLEAAKNKIK
jgi:rod shape-determining protein MreC